MVFFMESLQNKRSRNEDNYCHMDIRMNHEAVVSAYAVADGMGGLTAGDDYSRKAVSMWFEQLVRFIMSEEFRGCSLKSQIDSLKDFSSNSFHTINQSLYQNGMDAGIRGGTTLSTAIFFWDTWIFANCGDSPIYLMMNDRLEWGSQIQNVAWQLVRDGKTQPGSVLFQQNKNRLMQYLGRREEPEPYCCSMEANHITSILMGTDGAFGDLTPGQIEKIMTDTKKKDSVLQAVMELARNMGETDNQTGIYIRCQNEEMISPYLQSEQTSEITPVYNYNDEAKDRSVQELKSSLKEWKSSADSAKTEDYEIITDTAAYRSVQEESMSKRLRHFLKGRRS